MRGELKYILDKYNIDLEQARRLYTPIEIPGVKRERDLAPLFAELNYTSGAEIGVERGLFSEVLCVANPQATIYSIDAWEHYKGYRDHVSPVKLEDFYDNAVERLSPYNCVIIRKYSKEAVEMFDDESLGFVYIDANHRLESVIEDIVLWEKKVKRGGIISGHDYKQYVRQTYCHVVEALQAYTHAYRVDPWFLLGKRRESPKGVRDGVRSWMWVKG
jgi:hypothetical protein